MISFAEKLYISDRLRDRAVTIQRDLARDERLMGVYVIYVNPETGKEEAMRSELMSQSYYRTKRLTVTGLAADKEEALLYLASAAAEALTEQDGSGAPARR